MINEFEENEDMLEQMQRADREFLHRSWQSNAPRQISNLLIMSQRGAISDPVFPMQPISPLLNS